MDIQSVDGEKFAFLRGLKQFLENIRKILVPYPRLAGKIIDLHELYNKVTSFGGYEKVNSKELWEEFLYELKFPVTSASLSFGLKSIYQRYLQDYERIHFLGEDENQKKSRYDTTANYIKQPQHISDQDRFRYGLSFLRTTASTGGDYEKLSLSLLSCLPNEVDFAINACTLLSGESRHVLRLQNCPQVLDILLLHAGIITDDKSEVTTSRQIACEWKEKTKHDLYKFWTETVLDKTILKEILHTQNTTRHKRKIIDAENNTPKCRKTADDDHVQSSSFIEENNKGDDSEKRDWSFLFQSKRSLGIEDHEGQRILQISLVLLNLSFEDFNVSLLAKNKTLVRFVLLCIHSNYSSLHQTGLDILSNISGKLHLMELGMPITQLTYNIIKQSISSRDKFDQIRGFEILGKLCQNTDNQDSLIVAIDDHIVSSAIQILLVGDVELTLAALESLYRLSKLGEEVCTIIMLVNKGIDILICLITFTVHSFGSDQLSKIRIAKRAIPQIQQVQAPQRLPSYHQPVHGQKLPSQNYQPQTYVAQPPTQFNHPYPTPNYQPRPPHTHGMPVGYHPPNHLVHAYQPRPVVHKPPVPSIPQQSQHPSLHPQTPLRPIIPPPLKEPPHEAGAPRLKWGGPVYTHSETTTAPPVYHYMPAPPNDIVLDKSPRSFSKLWVWATYEPCENDEGSTPRVKVFAEYAAAASKYGMHNTNQVLPASEFGQCLQKVFPRTKSRLFKDSNGQPIYHITGIRKRQTPLPVPGHYPASSSSNQHPTHPPSVENKPTTQQLRASIESKNEVSKKPVEANVKTEPIKGNTTPVINNTSAIPTLDQNSTETDTFHGVKETNRLCNDLADSSNKTFNSKVVHNHIDNVQNSLKSPNQVPVEHQNGVLDSEEKMDIEDGNHSLCKTNNTVNKNIRKNLNTHCGENDECKENHSETTPNKNYLMKETTQNSTEPLLNGNGLNEEISVVKNEVPMVNGVMKTPPIASNETPDHTITSKPVVLNGVVQVLPEETESHESSTPAQTLPIAPNLLKNYYCEQKQKSTISSEIPADTVENSGQQPHDNSITSPITQSTEPSQNTNFFNVNTPRKTISTGVSAHSYPTPPVMLNSRLSSGSHTEANKTNSQTQSLPSPKQESLADTALHTNMPPLPQPVPPVWPSQLPTSPLTIKKKPNQIDLMAGNASLMVLHRNSGKQSFDDFVDEKEDPISHSIRLTAILILTNICRFSHEGKGLLKQHEHWLAYCCMSRMDSSCMLAKLLAELNR